MYIFSKRRFLFTMTLTRTCVVQNYYQVSDMMKFVVILGLIFAREMHAAAFVEKCAQLSTGNYRFGVESFAK